MSFFLLWDRKIWIESLWQCTCVWRGVTLARKGNRIVDSQHTQRNHRPLRHTFLIEQPIILLKEKNSHHKIGWEKNKENGREIVTSKWTPEWNQSGTVKITTTTLPKDVATKASIYSTLLVLCVFVLTTACVNLVIGFRNT